MSDSTIPVKALIYTASQYSVTVGSGAFTTITTMTLPAGRYILVGALQFAYTGTTGIRICMLETSESSINNMSNSVLATGRATLNMSRIISLDSTTTIYLRAYHAIGSSTTCDGQIKAVKLA